MAIPRNHKAYLGICFFSNFFMGWSRIAGISRTILLIRFLAFHLPLRCGSLEDFSEKIDMALYKVPFLFFARKQACLIRGFLLFFYGKRLDADVGLCFGCRWEQEAHRTHCWIVENGQIRFEVVDVINHYTVLMKYE